MLTLVEESLKVGRLSFDDVYDELFPAVFRFVKLKVEEAEVEDVAAEVMVRIWRSLGSFLGRGSLKSWSLTIAARTVADYYRKGKDVKPTLISDDMAISQGFDENVVLAVTVSDVLARLTEQQTSVIQLRLVEGLDAQQTASVMGLTRRAVDSLLYRARKRFQALYAQVMAGGEV